MKKISTFFLALSLILIISCDNNSSTEIDSNRFIEGRVVDHNGNGLSDIPIAISYGVDFYNLDGNYIDSLSYKLVDNPSQTTISFFLSSDNQTKLWVEDYYSNDTSIVLIDQLLEAGVHHIDWDIKDSSGRYVKNGVYNFCLEIDTLLKRSIAIGTYNYKNCLASEVNSFVTTDSNGDFTIDKLELIPTYLDSTIYGAEGDSVVRKFSNYINLWAINDQSNSNSSIDSLHVDPEEESDEIVISF